VSEEPEEQPLVSEEPEASPFEPELPPPEPEAEESESGEENPDDEVFFPEDTALELSPDEEESIFSEETPEDLAAQGSEDDFLDLEPDLPPPVEEIVPMEETLPEEEPDAEDEAVFEEPGAADEPEEKPAAEDEAVLEELSSDDEPELKARAAAGEGSFGPKADKPLDAEDIAKLLNHLKGLIRELPDKDMEQFLNSDVRLSLEFLIDILRGRRGLYKDIEERLGEDPETPENGEPAGAPPPAQVAGTLAYLERLASALPDQTLSAAITRKTDAVIAGIKQSGKTNLETNL
jgi:hypothetical protein